MLHLFKISLLLMKTQKSRPYKNIGATIHRGTTLVENKKTFSGSTVFIGTTR
jgi:hypothetical protein